LRQGQAMWLKKARARAARAFFGALEHDPEKHALPATARWVETGFFLNKANAERACAEIMLEQRDRTSGSEGPRPEFFLSENLPRTWIAEGVRGLRKENASNKKREPPPFRFNRDGGGSSVDQL
jgi:hypothetical protein